MSRSGSEVDEEVAIYNAINEEHYGFRACVYRFAIVVYSMTVCG